MSKILNRLRFNKKGEAELMLPVGTNTVFKWPIIAAESTKPKDLGEDPWGYGGSAADLAKAVANDSENLNYWWDMVSDRPGSDESRPDFCQHDWQEYQGFNEAYYFCTVCQKKKKL